MKQRAEVNARVEYIEQGFRVIKYAHLGTYSSNDRGCYGRALTWALKKAEKLFPSAHDITVTVGERVQ